MRLGAREAAARFAGARVARLATVSGAGQPHLVPVTFALLAEPDGRETVATAVDHKPKRGTDLKRLRNIRANPQVSLLADRYSDDWTRLWWARADGHARVTEQDERRAQREHGEPGGHHEPDGHEEPDGHGERGFAVSRALRELAGKYPQYRESVPGGPLILVSVQRWVGWAYADAP